MRILSILILLFAPYYSFSQNSFLGLFANSYLEQTRGAKSLKRINKQINIIYNKNYCSFYLEGKGVNFFKIRNYTIETIGDYIHTSFVSEETNSTPNGYYVILIDEGKGETIFQIALPNGYTFIVNKASKYSETGYVNHNVQFVKHKDNFAKSIELTDKINKYWDTVNNINFIANPSLKKKRLICNININEYINEKLNFHTTESKEIPIYDVHVYFDIDTTGKVSIQSSQFAIPLTNKTLVEDLSKINIDKKVKEIFMTIPWEIDNPIYGVNKNIYNCEVKVTVIAKPL